MEKYGEQMYDECRRWIQKRYEKNSPGISCALLVKTVKRN